jgi:phage-related protein
VQAVRQLAALYQSVYVRLEHRVFYVAKFEEAISVLHAFEKRTPRTAQAAVTLAQKRLAAFLARRVRNRETP